MTVTIIKAVISAAEEWDPAEDVVGGEAAEASTGWISSAEEVVGAEEDTRTEAAAATEE